jgi:hypothetical protein
VQWYSWDLMFKPHWLFTFSFQRFRAFQNSKPQNDSHLGVLAIHVLYTFTHLWDMLESKNTFLAHMFSNAPTLVMNPRLRSKITNFMENSLMNIILSCMYWFKPKTFLHNLLDRKTMEAKKIQNMVLDNLSFFVMASKYKSLVSQ